MGKTRPLFRKEHPMESTTVTFIERTRSYFSRVVSNESTKWGVAAAGAGFLMSLILEAAWPTAPTS
jgi:hypothetical protein